MHFFFLETTAETLQAPGNTRRSDIDSATGFHTLANNILRFYELECLPIQLNIERLDDGDGIPETFRKHNAKWHKTCNNKFNNLKLQRAEKRKSASKPNCSNITKFTRTSTGAAMSFSKIKSCCLLL